MIADVRSFVKGLSLEEKAALVVSVGLPKRTPGVAGVTRPIGAPPVTLAGGPSGLRIEPSGERRWYATAFPAPVMLAATWDVELVERVGRAMEEEAREYGVDVLLAPGINIHRHPLCGRNFEYFFHYSPARWEPALCEAFPWLKSHSFWEQYFPLSLLYALMIAQGLASLTILSKGLR